MEDKISNQSAVSGAANFAKYPVAAPFLTMQAICAKFGFDVADIQSKRRKHWISAQRRVVAREMRSLGYSLPAIGEAMGGKNHTSVIWMLKGGRGKREV